MNANHFLEDIHIENWQTFLSNNQEIETDLNYCCSNVADMVANITSISSIAPGVNDALSGLKNVSVQPINEGGELLSCINELSEYLKSKSLKIVSGISYAEKLVDAYNKGEDVPADATETFKAILQETADSNVYWVANEYLKTVGFGGIGFMLAYGTDAYNEGGNYVVGDGANGLFNMGSKTVLGVEPAVWMNAAVGAVVVAGFTAVMDYANDKGEMTDLDWERLGLNAGAAALGYAEWTLIAGSIGGIPGVVVAGLVALPSTYLFGSIRDAIVGDNIIDTFTINGQEYEVPRNGNGRDGTWDVLVENYEGAMQEYQIGNQMFSEHDYKDQLYSDWEDVIYRETGEHINDDPYFLGVESEFNEIMDQIYQCEDAEEASFQYYSYLSGPASSSARELSYLLSHKYGFNIEEMYEHMHANV